MINWNEPRFDEDDIASVTQALKDNYINEGQRTKNVERLLAKYLNVKYVIMTANGTASLFLAVKADAILKGLKDFEVIVPDYTMIATATAVGWAGGKVCLVDCEKVRFTIDTKKIEEKINSKTTAIIPVHILGRSADIEEIKRIAFKYGLSIIEDAAGALGSSNEFGYLGTYGDIGCFSLQSNKIITCGQGGFVVTNSTRLYETMRRLRDFGRLDNKDSHEIEGYNLKFNDLSAALIESQFKKLESRKNLLTKQRNMYQYNLMGIKDIYFPYIRNVEIPLWVDVVVRDRHELLCYLLSNEINPRLPWIPLHKTKPYSSQYSFENADYVSDNGLWLPNGFGISDKDIKFVCDKIKEFYND